MKLSREFKVALIVLLGILSIVFGFSYLKSIPIFNTSNTLYAVYNHVGGLEPGATVTIGGKSVGKIRNIEFYPNDKYDKFLITLSVNKDIDISKNSKSELFTDLLGGKGIQLLPVYDGADLVKSGDTLKSSVKPGITEILQDELAPLQQKIESTFTQLDALMGAMNTIMDEKVQASMRQSLLQLHSTIKEYNDLAKSMNGLVVDMKPKLNNSLSSLDQIASDFSEISTEIKEANIGSTVAELESTVKGLNAILSAVEKGEGSLGKLVHDEALYNNLEGTTKELEELLRDIKLHPKRYFRILSKKEIPYEEEKHN